MNCTNATAMGFIYRIFVELNYEENKSKRFRSDNFIFIKKGVEKAKEKKTIVFKSFFYHAIKRIMLKPQLYQLKDKG